MCWKLKDFGLTGRFLGESEEAYIGMNEAFAKGDRKYLEEICTPSMYAKLKGQLKERVGRYEWRYHGLLEKPQIVSIRQGQIGGHVLIQMIVRLHSNQVTWCLKVYNGVCLFSCFRERCLTQVSGNRAWAFLTRRTS